jgi:hypothetical protein
MGIALQRYTFTLIIESHVAFHIFMMPCLFRCSGKAAQKAGRSLSAGHCESICGADECNYDQSVRAGTAKSVTTLYSAAEVNIIFHDVGTFCIIWYHDALPFPL